MIRLDQVRERIADRVPALAGRLGNAAEFAQIVATNRLPQVTPAAFVLPGGLLGGEVDSVTGLFRQSFDEIVGVVLLNRVAGDPLADKALEEVTPLVRLVIEAVVGWVPGEGTDGEALGAMQLRQAELTGAKDGVLAFQIDFALNDQLRITT